MQGKKMSQTDLAKAAGLSREISRRYERNEVSSSVDGAKKIADIGRTTRLPGEGNNH